MVCSFHICTRPNRYILVYLYLAIQHKHAFSKAHALNKTFSYHLVLSPKADCTRSTSYTFLLKEAHTSHFIHCLYVVTKVAKKKKIHPGGLPSAQSQCEQNTTHGKGFRSIRQSRMQTRTKLFPPRVLSAFAKPGIAKWIAFDTAFNKGP